MRRGTALLFALLVVSFSCVVEAWVFHGPYGGSVNQFLFNPVNPQIIFLHSASGNSDYGFLYRSIDGGETWNRLNFETGAVRMHPKDPPGFYAEVGGTLFRSFDSGSSWNKLNPPGRSRDIIYDFAIHPFNPNVLYVLRIVEASGADSDIGFFVSTNGGGSWVRRSTLDLQEVEHMAVDPNDGNTIYFTGINETGIRLYKSIDGGFKWTTSEFGGFFTTSITIDPKNSQRIYIGRGDFGVVKSTNGGKTFSPINCNCSASALTIDPKNSQKLYIAGSDGLWRSVDGGQNWSIAKLPLSNYSFNPTSINISPKNSNLLFTGSGYIGLGIYKSDDGGGSWKSRNHGLDARSVDHVRVNPMLQSDIFATSNSVLLHSTDSGDSWSRIKVEGVRDANFLLRHPVNPDLILIANNVFGEFAISKNKGKAWHSKKFPFDYALAVTMHPSDQNIIYASTYDALFRSEDQGDSWQKLASTGAPETISIVISKSNPQIIFTLSGEYGQNKVFKSEDAGKSWKNVNPTGFVPGQVLINPQNDQIIYVVAGYFNKKIAKSVDGGKTWVELSLPNNLGPFQIDPLKPDHIFSPRIFSLDGAKSWRKFDLNGLSPAITIYDYLDLDLVPGRLFTSTNSGIYSHQIP